MIPIWMAGATSEQNTTITAVIGSPRSHISMAPPRIVVLVWRPETESPINGDTLAMMRAIAAAHVSDLVLDIRYNGGGWIAIASELAYMVAGPGPTAAKAFERTVFSYKYTSKDPVTGEPIHRKITLLHSPHRT